MDSDSDPAHIGCRDSAQQSWHPLKYAAKTILFFSGFWQMRCRVAELWMLMMQQKKTKYPFSLILSSLGINWVRSYRYGRGWKAGWWSFVQMVCLPWPLILHVSMAALSNEVTKNARNAMLRLKWEGLGGERYEPVWARAVCPPSN